MKIRTFELCAGYDSQLMALERLKRRNILISITSASDGLR